MKRLHPSNRTSSPEEDDDRRRERLVAQLVRAAAAAVDTPDAVALAEEALPFDNEALALAEGCDPAAGAIEGRHEP